MEYIPYFRYGRAYKIVPSPPNSLYEDRELINYAEKIVCDGKMYDLTSAESIYSIPIPDYSKMNRGSIESPVLYLEYVLRMHASYLWKKKEMNTKSVLHLPKNLRIWKQNGMITSKTPFVRLAKPAGLF